MHLDFCAFCGERDCDDYFFVPLALGGREEQTNIITVCGACKQRTEDEARRATAFA
jgi:hypothetical protein